MGQTYGHHRHTAVSGTPIKVSADGNSVKQQATIAWGTVAAVSGDTTLDSGDVIKDGKKYLRWGQVLCKITQSEIQTVDLSGDDDPTGGTWDITAIGPDGESIEGIAYNVTAAALQALIRALNFKGAERVTVTKSGFVYTITFPADAGNVPTITTNDGDDFTGGGGDTFAITVLTTTSGLSYGGQYGPYDPSATDGRQTLTQGNLGIVDELIVEEAGVLGFNTKNTNHVALLVGGRVFWGRILTTTGTHTLAAGPTNAELLAALPGLFPVKQF